VAFNLPSAVLAVALGAYAGAASAQQQWSLDNTSSGGTTEGLTYTLTGTEVDADTWSFVLLVQGINVAGVDTRGGRSALNDLSFSEPTGYIGASLSGATTLDGGLSSSGCNGKGASQFCFGNVDASVIGQTMTLKFTIDAPSGSFLSYVPHLKADWVGSANNYDLVSANMVTPVPEPSTYALMLAGLAAVGFMARRRRRG